VHEKDHNLLLLRRRGGEADAVALDEEIGCPVAGPALQPIPKPAAAAKTRRKG